MQIENHVFYQSVLSASVNFKESGVTISNLYLVQYHVLVIKFYYIIKAHVNSPKYNAPQDS